jgi:transcriptional regulator with XRE-family HTH domain
MARTGSQPEELVGEIDVEANLRDHLDAVGVRLRSARKSEGLSIQQLADETGLSTAMISLVERGLAVPSLGTLAAIGSKLRLSLGELFAHQLVPEEEGLLHRKSDQRVIQVENGRVTRTVIFESMKEGLRISRDDWKAHTKGEPDPARHPGWELGYVLSGHLVVEVEGHQHHLSAGDCVAYESTSLHRVENRSARSASAIWLNLFRRWAPALY